MKQLTVSEQEGGQRLDKLLHKILKGAPDSFLYKMLRKKNITLNGKKADGSERVSCGDSIVFFLSDETFDKFASHGTSETASYEEAYRKIGRLEVLYEDEGVLLVNKPAGLLSQKAASEDLSLNEWLIGYLLREGRIDGKTLRTFRPSVCNRLDRNTSGLVICGTSLAGSRLMNAMLKDRTLHKYYRLLVKGSPAQDGELKGWLQKDAVQNQVRILTREQYNRLSPEEQAAYARVETRYRTLDGNGKVSLVEAELITGKTHQIRAHLSGIGHPLLGDAKYGDASWNRYYRERYGVKHQLLHAYRLEFPRLEPPFERLSGQSVLCDMPPLYETILREE